MNTPNPLVPQGSLPARGKSTVRIAFFTIAAIHVVFIGGLLMQGCKKSETKTGEMTDTNTAPSIPPFVEPVATNPPPSNVTAAPNVEVPTPPTVPVVNPSFGAQEHVVTKGDNFSAIAKKYGVSVKAVEQANPGVSSSKLKVGQKLQIPAASNSASTTPAATMTTATADGDTTTYVVRAGDMLEKIARTHGTTAKTIMRLNNMKTTMIRPGQKLKLPATKTSNTEPVATPGYVTPLPSAGSNVKTP